jgi:hypothetical protein
LLTALRDDNPKKENVTTALAMVAGITLLDVMAAQGTTARHSRTSGDRNIYRNRTGFPGGLAAARGAAKEFQVPPHMRAALAAGSDGARHKAAPAH